MTIEISARYCLSPDEQRATVLLDGDLYLLGLDEDLDAPEAQHETFLTIIHERVGAPPDQREHGGRFLRQYEVACGESLTLIARRQGRIVASLVNEIDTSPCSRVLLRPKGGFHVIIHQEQCESLEDVQVMAVINEAVVKQLVRQISLPTPGTQLLLQLMQAVERHYATKQEPLPETIRLLWSAMNDAVTDNHDRHSIEMLSCLSSAVEASHLHNDLRISPLYDQVEAFLADHV